MKLKYKMILKSKLVQQHNFKILSVLLIGIIIMSLTQSCSASLYGAETNRQAKIELSPQFHEGKFRNITKSDHLSAGNFLSSLWDWIFKSGEFRPEDSIPAKKVNLTEFITENDNQLKVSWFGHSSTIINLDGFIILTDPVFDESLSIVGPSRFDYQLPLELKDIPKIDLVIISHNHRDHLSIPTLEKIKDKVAHFVMPLGVGSYLEDLEIPDEKIIELDWWEETEIGSGFFVAATPSQHFSGRGLTDTDKSLWASWVIKGKNNKIFFTGDTGYFEEFKQIGKKYGPFDLTLMECGQYGENWAPIHMTPEESVQAHLDVKGKIMLPIHWGGFKLALHDWFDPIERAVKKADEVNVKIATPMIGEVVSVDEKIPQEHWWINYKKGIEE